MYYERMFQGIFLRRPNRFIAEVEIQGKMEICHVKNTGRCRELLVPGARVIVQKADHPNRKTSYDLISVYKGEMLVNMDSQIPNAVVEEWIRKGGLFQDLTLLKREVVFGNSRFDLYAEYGEKKAWLEVKGVTLEENGIASFPDAPTERGVRHVEELCRCVEAGYEAYLIFVIQMKGMSLLRPNWERHAAFGRALVQAKKAGVHILAYDCQVTEQEIVMDEAVEISLTY